VPVDNLNLEDFFITGSRMSVQPMSQKKSHIFILSSGSSSQMLHVNPEARLEKLIKCGEGTRSCSRLPQCGFAPVGGSSFLQQLAAVRTPSYGSVPRCTSEWPCAMPIFFLKQGTLGVVLCVSQCVYAFR